MIHLSLHRSSSTFVISVSIPIHPILVSDARRAPFHGRHEGEDG